MERVPHMVDMAITPVEIENVKVLPQNDMGSEPIYPYGLSLCLNDDSLEKLSMEDDCAVGDMVHFHCLGRVTACSDHENAGKRIEIQIIAMSAESEDEENEEAEEDMKPHRIKNPYLNK